MADVQVIKRKIGISPTARITNYPSRPSSPSKSTRPSSSLKRAQVQDSTSPSDSVKPRAKVNSSVVNVPASKKPPSALSLGYQSGSSTPRAPSPVRKQNSQKASFPNGIGARTLSRVRSKAALSAVSAPSSPRVASVRSEYTSLSAATSDSALAKVGPPRVRRPSISSVSRISSPPTAPSSVCSPPLSAVSFSQDSDAQSNMSTHRIKAKVTSLAKGKSAPHVQPSPSPLLMPSPALERTASQTPLSPASQFRRLGRTVSIGSFSAPPTPPHVYPITTANPAANVHRYATLRSPSYTHRPPQPFTSPLQTGHKPPESDPTLVPLPPLSPPASHVSFSSQSSISRSSLTSTNRTAAPGIHLNGTNHFRKPSGSYAMENLGSRSKSRSNSLVINDISPPIQQRADSSEPDIDESREEQNMKAEAKSYRKIADLEITTKSLLAINSQLETNKHKQAKEIRELRRKLRESQLSLPPRTYRELKESGDAVDDEEPEEQEVDGDEDAKLTAEAIKLGKEDQMFDRVRLIIENLLTTGKQALAVKVEDLAPPKGAAKVLHEEEARTWRGDSGSMTPAAAVILNSTAKDDSSSSSDYGEEILFRTIGSSSQEFNSSLKSEREVEEMIGNLRASLSASLRA
ncbi:hypothetical protein ACEPAF_3754 [Sanghuangporus sanghuang]